MFKQICIREIVLSIFIIAPFAVFANYIGTSICVIRSLFGVPCPGCGMTTAGMAVFDGRFAFAAQTNALVFAAPLVLCVMIADLWLKKPEFSRIAKWIYAIAAAALVIYFIVRMVMSFPDGAYPINTSETTMTQKIIELFRK